MRMSFAAQVLKPVADLEGRSVPRNNPTYQPRSVLKHSVDTRPSICIYIYLLSSKRTTRTSAAGTPILPCVCANLRRASRVVTRLYNMELRSERIEITQFTLLMALHQTGEIPQGKLGKLLALDSTTLTRMLELLKKRGWIQDKEGDDRRFRLIRLTSAGRAKFQQSLPHWKRAQDRLQTVLGDETAAQLEGLLADVVRASVEE